MKLTPQFIETCAQWVRENGLQDFGGASVQKYCNEMGIDKKTHYNWMRNTKSSYSSEIEKAKEYWRDNMEHEIVDSLFEAAKGYEYTKTKTEIGSDKDGRPVMKKQTTENVKVAPNVGAAVFLLTNIAPDRWKNKIQNDVNANVRGEVEKNVSYDFDDIPDEKLYELADMMQDAEFKRTLERKNGKKKD